MSGIIKKISNHKKKFAAMCLFAALITGLLLFRLYIPAILLTAIAIVNELTFKKMCRQTEPFGTRSRIRNVDCLVIGDFSTNAAEELAGTGSTVCIQSPGCTLAGAYEVLRHTFSILKEDRGKAVLVVKRKNLMEKRFSLFETVFFHRVTLKRLGLENRKRMSRFPAVFSPLRSLLFLFGGFPAGERKTYRDTEIQNFCMERGIELSILEV